MIWMINLLFRKTNTKGLLSKKEPEKDLKKEVAKATIKLIMSPIYKEVGTYFYFLSHSFFILAKTKIFEEDKVNSDLKIDATAFRTNSL